MSEVYKIGEKLLSLSDVSKIISEEMKLELSEESIQKIKDCRKYLDEKMKKSENPIYGINTGFGSLCNHKISDSDLEQLQRNLVISHSCGTGDEVPLDVVKIIILLKIQSLSYGHSAVQLKTVGRLIEMFKKNILQEIIFNYLKDLFWENMLNKKMHQD